MDFSSTSQRETKNDLSIGIKNFQRETPAFFNVPSVQPCCLLLFKKIIESMYFLSHKINTWWKYVFGLNPVEVPYMCHTES